MIVDLLKGEIMAAYSVLTTAVTGNTITAAIWNDEFDAVADSVNSITNAQVAAGAGIAYSKLALTGAILDADLAGSIAATKITNTAVTLTDTQTLTNKTLTTPTLTKPTINGSVQGLTTDTDGATITFNMTSANVHQVTLAGNRTLAVSNVSTGQIFTIILIQDGTGNRTVTWFGSILWAGAAAPTLTSTASRRDVFVFLYDGTNYLGMIGGQNLG